MSGLAVFGYGSLVSPESAALTLGRPVEVIPATLRGWRRRWSLVRDNMTCEKTFARASDGELFAWCLGLNVERAAGEPGPNGGLIEVTEAEAERLDLREMRYDRADVTGAIGTEVAAAHGFNLVIAWTAKPEHHCPAPPPGAVIIAGYVAALERAFTDLGPGELERFRRTTEPPPVEVVEAVLVGDRIPVGNPRDW